MKKFGLKILGLLVFGTLLAHLSLIYLFKISRAELGIDVNESCTAPFLPSLWQIMPDEKKKWGYPDYNADLVAGRYSLYAAIASNAYETPSERFNIEPKIFEWKKFGLSVTRSGGFSANIYHKESIDEFSVLVAFRGTDGSLAVDDWLSNLSYFTQLLNPWDQYRTARDVFREVRQHARRAAGGKRLTYYVVGHSLGGGLARHVAAAFPCTSAIVFNSSFVANQYRLESPYPATVVDIFEKEDPLSRIALFAKPSEFFSMNKTHQWYRLNNIEKSGNQHEMYSAARSMARIAAECVTVRANECWLLKKVTIGRSYGENGDSNCKEFSLEPMGVEKSRQLYCKALPKGSRTDGLFCPAGSAEWWSPSQWSPMLWQPMSPASFAAIGSFKEP